MSLRARLTALVVGAFTVGLVVLGLVVPALVRNYLIDRLDADLQSSAMAAANAALGANQPPYERPGRPGDDAPRRPVASEAYVEVRDTDGNVVAAGWAEGSLTERALPDLPDTLTARSETGFTVGSVGPTEPDRYRAMTFPVHNRATGQSATLLVAVPTTDVDETVRQIVRVTAITAAAILVAVALLSWALVRFGLRPLRRMERTAAAISSAGDLHQRIDHPGPRTELGALGGTLNSMLASLEGSFAAQQATEARLRRFVSDASHELRTPLTSIRGYAELYRRGGASAEQVERSMGRIEDEADRMARLVNDLLLLARLDESSPLERTSVDLAALVEGLVDDMRTVDPGRAVSLRAEPCSIVGDRHRIAQAVANVLTNARVHTPSASPVDVRVAARDASVVIEVADHGPGLTAEARERVFDRFFRADTSRARSLGGSGLGLAITAAIVHAHGGTIEVVDTPGGGATFRVLLPCLPATDGRDGLAALAPVSTPDAC